MRRTGKARRAGYTLAAVGCALAATVVAAPAANATAGGYCGTYGNGYTDQTIFYKQPPGCYDFNLTWTKWTGDYKGWYWSNNQWVPCTEPAVHHVGGENYLQVLCSNVATGTPLIVMRNDTSGSNQGWNIHVNY